MTALYENLEKSKLFNKRKHISDCQGLGREIHCEREQKNVLK